jgi:branched-chain amino acid transport system permease protein
MFWFGLFFVTMVLFKPEGLAGLIQDARAAISRRWLPAGAAVPVREPGE